MNISVEVIMNETMRDMRTCIQRVRSGELLLQPVRAKGVACGGLYFSRNEVVAMRQCGICRTLYPGICQETDEICVECRSNCGWEDGVVV